MSESDRRSRLGELRAQRAKDVYALVTADRKLPVSIFESAEPQTKFAKDDSAYALSGRELTWFCFGAATIATGKGRDTGAPMAALGVTAPYSVERVVVTYQPDYYFISPTPTAVTVYTYYVAVHALLLPTIQTRQM